MSGDQTKQARGYQPAKYEMEKKLFESNWKRVWTFSGRFEIKLYKIKLFRKLSDCLERVLKVCSINFEQPAEFP